MNRDDEPAKEAPLFDPTLQKQAHGEAGRKHHAPKHDERDRRSETDEGGKSTKS